MELTKDEKLIIDTIRSMPNYAIVATDEEFVATATEGNTEAIRNALTSLMIGGDSSDVLGAIFKEAFVYALANMGGSEL